MPPMLIGIFQIPKWEKKCRAPIYIFGQAYIHPGGVVINPESSNKYPRHILSRPGNIVCIWRRALLPGVNRAPYFARRPAASPSFALYTNTIRQTYGGASVLSAAVYWC